MKFKISYIFIYNESLLRFTKELQKVKALRTYQFE